MSQVTLKNSFSSTSSSATTSKSPASSSSLATHYFTASMPNSELDEKTPLIDSFPIEVYEEDSTVNKFTLQMDFPRLLQSECTLKIANYDKVSHSLYPKDTINLSEKLKEGKYIVYLYPGTGSTDPEWPNNAKGCTPQNNFLKDSKSELDKFGYEAIGISTQNIKDQAAFSEKNDIRHLLLNDTDHVLLNILEPARFKFKGYTYYERQVFLVEKGEVIQAYLIKNVEAAKNNHTQIVEFLSQRYTREA